MNRKELIEKMAVTGRNARRAAGSPIKRYHSPYLPSEFQDFERASAEAVLDMLTAEAVPGVVGYETLTDNNRCWADTSVAGEEVDIIAVGLDVVRDQQYPLTGTAMYGGTSASTIYEPGATVRVLILDLPEPDKPTVEAQAAELLRSMAKVVDGIDADVLKGAADEARALADALDKGATDDD